jgi:GTPase KRas protein
MKDQYMRSGEGFVCVYDITSRQTWEELRTLCDKVLQVQQEDEVPMVIVGNKCDLGEARREVTVAEGKELATTFHAQFYEASAKLGTNVEASFFDLVRNIRQRRSSSRPAVVKSTRRICPLF